MAYFSNGSEGESYFERYCSRCLHDNEAKEIHCPIWNLHLAHNSKGANDKGYFLHALIPQGKEGGNERCTMFVDRGLLSNLQIKQYEHERTK